MCGLGEQPDTGRQRKSRKNPEIICKATFARKIQQLPISTRHARTRNTRKEEGHANDKICKNSIKNNKLNKLFKLGTKEHDMELRTEEKYQVTKARTERLNQSSIPYMQRLLDINHSEDRTKEERLDRNTL